jgi:DNA-binding transcriptional MerR regulator
VAQSTYRKTSFGSPEESGASADEAFRIEELSILGETSVDTIRYYQSIGLLPPPIRTGRIAIYKQEHLDILRRVAELKEVGWSLAAIKTELSRFHPNRKVNRVEFPYSPVRLLILSELSEEAELPEAILLSLVADRIIEPTTIGKTDYFSEFDLMSARAALELLKAGLPLAGLMEIAKRDKSSIDDVLDLAVGVFDEHIRKNPNQTSQSVLEMFDELFEASSALVVNHFRSELLRRSLNAVLATGSQTELELISQRIGISLQNRRDIR